MPSKTRPTKRSPTLRAPAKRNPSAPRRASRPEAWITDPEALLSAMAVAERAERETPQPLRAAEQTGHTPEVIAPVREPLRSLPALRFDERIGHQSESGVIVIIRRRRAA